MSLASSLAPMTVPANALPYVKTILPLAKDVYDVSRAYMVKGSIGAGIETSKKVAKHVTLPLKTKLKWYATRSTDMVLRNGVRIAKKILRLGGGERDGFAKAVARIKEQEGYQNWLRLKDNPVYREKAKLPQYQEPKTSRKKIHRWKIAMHDWDDYPFGVQKNKQEIRKKHKEDIETIQRNNPTLIFPDISLEDFDYFSNKAWSKYLISYWKSASDADSDADFTP